jgi:hypothetical protein
MSERGNVDYAEPDTILSKSEVIADEVPLPLVIMKEKKPIEVQ